MALLKALCKHVEGTAWRCVDSEGEYKKDWGKEEVGLCSSVLQW